MEAAHPARVGEQQHQRSDVGQGHETVTVDVIIGQKVHRFGLP